jgi:UDP-glucose 4-epimerase
MAYAMLIEAINTNKPFTVFGNGEQKRSNTYIDDIVSATILAEENSMNNYVMNVCGDETVSLNEVIEILQEISDKKLTLVGGANRTGDQKVTSGLNTKIKQTLGWESKTSIREGLLAQYEASLRTI